MLTIIQPVTFITGPWVVTAITGAGTAGRPIWQEAATATQAGIETRGCGRFRNLAATGTGCWRWSPAFTVQALWVFHISSATQKKGHFQSGVLNVMWSYHCMCRSHGQNTASEQLLLSSLKLILEHWHWMCSFHPCYVHSELLPYPV